MEYSEIKGVNYTPSYACNDIETWRDYDAATVERELGYAKRLGLNRIRVFLQYAVYAHDREKFLRDLLHMVRTADSLGLKVMPIVFDSCFSLKEPVIDFDCNEWIPNPGVMHLGKDFWPQGEAYCRDLIDLLRNENGLLLWDIMNEPLCTEYFYGFEGAVREQHKQEIYAFLKHFCDYFRANDTHPTTVGHDNVQLNDETHDWVDVLSYHNYWYTEKTMQDIHDIALAQGEKYHMQVFCSEIGCPGRANPYDISIEILNRNKIGYFLWELMIGKSFWNDRHGIVYADGTIRDAATVAAINGFFRRRANRLPYVADTEGGVTNTVKLMEKWLASDEKDISEGLELIDRVAHILESNLLVPEKDLPTAVYYALRNKAGLSSEVIASQLTDWLPVMKASMKLDSIIPAFD